jgi:hypothetical protein
MISLSWSASAGSDSDVNGIMNYPAGDRNRMPRMVGMLSHTTLVPFERSTGFQYRDGDRKARDPGEAAKTRGQCSQY